MSGFAELCCASNFSFLRGASHGDELVLMAKVLGLAAIGIADRNTMAGVVRAHAAAKEHGQRLLVGTRLVSVPSDACRHYRRRGRAMFYRDTACGPRRGFQHRAQ